MHNEKNIFDNVFNTMMDVNGKTKDNIKARYDIRRFCNRPELFIDPIDQRKQLKPEVCYTLTKKLRRFMLEWIKELRFADG
jgi:hypothetical protein